MHKNIKNIFLGFFSQAVILVLGLIVPRIILTHYNSDINGLTSTITQIFSYMALLEAGIGQATTNALYPFVNGEKHDKKRISEVMVISRHYYRKITVIYAVVVLTMALVLPLILKTNVSYYTVFGVVLFEGLTQVVSFWSIQNWTMLLIVDGRNYVKSNIELVNKVLCYAIKIVLALKGVNIAFVQLGFFAVSLLKYVLYKKYMLTHYSWVDFKCKNTDHLELKDRNSYIITEIAWTVFSSTDMIVLSIFCSTTLASVYAVYSMIFTAMTNLLDAIYNGIRFNLGQAYHDNIERYKKVHDLFNSVFMGTMTAMVCVAYLLIIPFIRIYTKGVNDVNYVNLLLPVMFCSVQMISWSRYIAGNLTGLAGFAKKVSYISLIEASINLIGSIILVNKFGVVGVLMATVIALPLKSLYCNWISDHQIMKRNGKRTISILGVNFLCFSVVVLCSSLVTINISSFRQLVLWGIVLSMISFSAVMTINMIVNRDLLKLFVGIVKKVLTRKSPHDKAI